LTRRHSHYYDSLASPLPVCEACAMPHLLFGSFSSLKVIDEFPRFIGIGSWLYHLVLLNSQYSSLEAALDQAGLIDLYFG
jgi:hypothetical protein